jgi:MHS family alpha-ketoglutarate permease-like MFS transporter
MRAPSPVAQLRALARHPRAVATVVGLTAGGTLAFYTFTTYAQKFLVTASGFSKPAATRVTAAALLVFMASSRSSGLLSDRVGRRPVLVAFGTLGTLATWPLLEALAAARTEARAFVPARRRARHRERLHGHQRRGEGRALPHRGAAIGVALPYAVTVSLFGGTAEWLALRAQQLGHPRWYYAWVTACVAASLAVYVGMRETRDREEFG